MLRHSQLQGLQCDPVDGSPLSHGSQTTSSTLSDLVPSSNLRVVRPEAAPQALFSPATLENGDISRSELWWRDRYYAIKAAGYKLRPRYHPRWQPSWKRSGKDSREAEDAQLCQVRAVRSTPPFLTDHLSHMLRSTRHVPPMVDRSYSGNSFPSRHQMSYSFFEFSPLLDSEMIPTTIAYRCLTSSTYPRTNIMVENYWCCRSCAVSITLGFKHMENLSPSLRKFVRSYPTSYVRS